MTRPTIPGFMVQPSSEPIIGHGIALNAKHDVNQGVYPGHLGPLVQAAKSPGCALVVVKQFWSEIETGEGSYDTTFLRSCLDAVVAANPACKLVVQVMHKAFHEGDQAAPEWIESVPTHVTHMPGGTTSNIALIWRPDVAARLHAVYLGVDEACRDHPTYGGVATEETAVSVSEEVRQQTNYSASTYAMTLMGLGDVQQAMKGRLFWYMNYLAERQPYLYTVAQSLAARGVAIGGPNLMPPNPDLTGKELEMSDSIQQLVEPIYDTLPDTAYTFGCAQAVDMRNYSPQVLVEHARARKRSLVIWTLRMAEKDEEALALIADPNHGLREPLPEPVTPSEPIYRIPPEVLAWMEAERGALWAEIEREEAALGPKWERLAQIERMLDLGSGSGRA